MSKPLSRTRKRAADLVPGDRVAVTGREVTRVLPTRKGDKVQVYVGEGVPKVLANDEHVWVLLLPVSQVPSA